MTTETKTIIDVNLSQLMVQFQEHVQNGWEMDPNNSIGQFGFAWEMGLYRNDKTVAALLAANPEAPPKMSREESLAKAREARAAKRQEAVQ